ncbi:UvrD-helicase domain-containing protein [Patescibacteria group bacterium]|nr:UvrD-helicase domain-containing protein [Patescibacteria group bacterium]
MTAELLELLNDQQRQAVLHPEGPAIVLAGAGSGKTRVLTTRAAWLIGEQHVPANSILLVTFTNKAAQEIAERMFKITGQELPFAGTFHRICAKILRRDGHLIGLPAHFLILDSDDQLDLLKQIYKNNSWSDKEFHPRAVKAAISTAKNEMLGVDEYTKAAKGKFQEFVAKAYTLYQRELAQNFSVDFDDLLLKVIELFTLHPEVLERYQQTLSHVLIDEYQDTNKAQYVLSKLLSAPQNNLYVVGDFSQSIYAWRGADYRNMLNLTTDFPTIQEYRLEQNYRSSQTILDAATNVISQNTSHPILQLWTENTDQEPIVIYEADSGEDEARKVVEYIKTKNLSHSYADQVILYRTNAQSRAFEEAFIRNRIPYRIVGGVKFYARREVKDVLSYLRLFINPNDSVSLERATKLGKRKLDAFLNWKNSTLAELAKNDITNVQDVLPLAALQKILEVTQYTDKYNPKDPEDLSRLENVQELLSVASQFQQIDTFLENIALIQDETMSDVTAEGKQDVITLMSLHSAKGLEFPIVYMVGMEEGLFPHSRSIMDKEQMEEERRLAYVGITRAKERLYITYARRRLVYGSITNAMPSRFLHDIPDHLVKKESASFTRSANFGGYGSGYDQAPNKWKERFDDDVDHEEDRYGLKALNSRLSKIGSQRRFVPLDDTALDDVLSGDVDIEAFLKK